MINSEENVVEFFPPNKNPSEMIPQIEKLLAIWYERSNILWMDKLDDAKL